MRSPAATEKLPHQVLFNSKEFIPLAARMATGLIGSSHALKGLSAAWEELNRFGARRSLAGVKRTVGLLERKGEHIR
jgi:hypothetical protein